MFDLESGAYQSTEFAKSRFCIPFLQRRGWALFIDCDMVCRADIKELFDCADDRFAVQVVKHEYKVVEATKMDGQVNSAYPRKNWSSVVLWNLDHPAHRRLPLWRVQQWPGRDLHAFKWLQDDEIGELPNGWNHLVGISSEPEKAKMLHFTNGGLWLDAWKGGPHDDEWNLESVYLQARRAA